MFPGRTTQAAVQGIVLDSDVRITDFSPFIDSANELVTEVCGVLDANSNNLYGYTDHRLELIERYLAAHFLCVTDRQSQEEHAGPVGQRTPGTLNLGLDNTVYGQQAKRLDTAGALAVMENGMNDFHIVPKGLAAKITVGITALGIRYRKFCQ